LIHQRLPILAVTPGEPSGIGPDLCINIANENLEAQLVFFADPDLLEERAALLGVSLDLNLLPENFASHHIKTNSMNILPVKLVDKVEPGKLNPHNAAYVLETLRKAVTSCQSGLCDGMVTAPVHKGIINDAGMPFTGHTEYLAELLQADPVMMLTCPGLRVALATTHLPVSQISQSITRESLEQVIRIIHFDLIARFALEHPAIYICGLNPHAGENGHLGTEEIDTIMPVIDKLNQEGFNLVGPLPADTIFTPKVMQKADVILAMYHDQRLPVLKHMGFGEAVNITLGLPIIRTSVDHGTALELAGTGKADPGSLLMAIQIAIEMAENSQAR
jgi:4-hydroxythreonine-4-phosphate dehydrogenase